MIKQYISQIKKNELMMGSIIIIVLSFLGNLFSYLFQFFMARMLGPVDYVVIAIITSIVGIFAIPTLAIQTVISKNTTELKVQKQEGKIIGMMNYTLVKMLKLAALFFVLCSLFSIFLAQKLNIDYIYFFIGEFFIFGAFTYPVLAGIVQGLKKFKELGTNTFIICFVKFIVGVALVLAGFKIYGGILGFLSGVVVAFFILFLNIKSIVKAKPEKFEISIFSKENIYPLIAMIIMVLFYSLDVIFAKVFFASDIAGQYAVISLIGKIILTIVASVGTAMFPINTERHFGGGNTKSVFRKAMLFSAFIGVSAVTVFSIFPHFVVNLLFGAQYAPAYNLLTYCAIAFSFSSLLYIILLHNISINKINLKEVIILSGFLLIEIALFFLFNQTIEKFVMGFMISNIIAFLIAAFVLKK